MCIFLTYMSIICKGLSTRNEVGPLSPFCIHCLTLISSLQNMQNTFNKANLKNNFVSPYWYGSVGRTIIFLTSQTRYPFFLIVYSKTCLKRPLSKRQKIVCFIFKIIKTDYRIMQVKSIAECSKGAFCNTFDLHLALICLNYLCCVYL